MITEQILIHTTTNGTELVWLRQITWQGSQMLGQSMSRHRAALFCLLSERPSE